MMRVRPRHGLGDESPEGLRQGREKSLRGAPRGEVRLGECPVKANGGQRVCEFSVGGSRRKYAGGSGAIQDKPVGPFVPGGLSP